MHRSMFTSYYSEAFGFELYDYCENDDDYDIEMQRR